MQGKCIPFDCHGEMFFFAIRTISKLIYLSHTTKLEPLSTTVITGIGNTQQYKRSALGVKVLFQSFSQTKTNFSHKNDIAVKGFIIQS